MSNKSLITSYKIVLVGDTGVGKSSIATQFANNEFSDFQESTIGAAFFTKSIEIDGTSYKIDVWDTAGQERYHSLTPMYYRGAKIALIVFDITNLLSYEKMKQWSSEIKNSVNNIVITIVGNKIDLEHRRKVSKEDAIEYCMQEGFEYYETSAKTAENIELIFEKSIKNIEPEENLETVETLNVHKQIVSRKRCC
tara:strand:- start:1255 stop:1839 length:585 start_codon:yes stop_codon:yes gene_type:complete